MKWATAPARPNRTMAATIRFMALDGLGQQTCASVSLQLGRSPASYSTKPTRTRHRRSGGKRSNRCCSRCWRCTCRGKHCHRTGKPNCRCRSRSSLHSGCRPALPRRMSSSSTKPPRTRHRRSGGKRSNRCCSRCCRCTCRGKHCHRSGKPNCRCRSRSSLHSGCRSALARRMSLPSSSRLHYHSNYTQPPASPN